MKRHFDLSEIIFEFQFSSETTKRLPVTGHFANV